MAIWIRGVSSKWKSRKKKFLKTEKVVSLHNSTSDSNEECLQQKNDSKCKDSPTVVDGKNSENHKTRVIDSTTVNCKLCGCNGKIAKKLMKAK